MNNPSEQKKIEKFFRLTSDTFCGMVLSADKTQNTNEVAMLRSAQWRIAFLEFGSTSNSSRTQPRQHKLTALVGQI